MHQTEAQSRRSSNALALAFVGGEPAVARDQAVYPATP
jgi:hypothetical protein